MLVNVNSTNSKLVSIPDTSTALEEIKALPVGTPVEPGVPEHAYILE